MLTSVLWGFSGNKVSVGFLQQLDLKNMTKNIGKIFGIIGLNK